MTKDLRFNIPVKQFISLGSHTYDLSTYSPMPYQLIWLDVLIEGMFVTVLMYKYSIAPENKTGFCKNRNSLKF